MGTYVLRNVIQGSYFLVHANQPASPRLGPRRNLRFAIRLVVLLLCIFATVDRIPANAGFVEEQKLLEVGGHSVAIGGSRIVVGSPGEVNSRGAVHVYRYDGSMWLEEKKLTAPDGQDGDGFGVSVAINSAGNLFVVSAPRRNNDRGSAYVFRLGLGAEGPFWSEGQEIIPSDGAPQDFFGLSTAISDDRIVIGSPLHNDMVSRSGAVYIYRKEEIVPGQTIWVEEQKLVASDRTEEDSLGWSVASDGDRIVAGAIQTGFCSTCGGRPGAAYVFNRSSGIWEFEAKLTPSDGTGGDYFGDSVTISGERIAVATASARSVYVFRRNDITQWVPDQKLGPFYENQGFLSFPPRSTVAIAGNRLVVGAPRSNTDLRGAVHLFEFDPAIGGTGTWARQQILTGGDADMVCCRFGRPLAISGERIVVSELATQAVYIFHYRPDSDGDGVTDDRDQCDNSDIRPTIIIGTCDSGVVNVLSMEEPAGCSITDEIMKLAADAKSHGQFLSQVDKFLQELQSDGILEPNEKNAIKDCATQSDLP